MSRHTVYDRAYLLQRVGRERNSALEQARWHEEKAAAWAPYPLAFGPFGDAVIGGWHAHAAREYKRAATDMSECLDEGLACDTAAYDRAYSRFEWAVGRTMQFAVYSSRDATYRPVDKKQS